MTYTYTVADIARITRAIVRRSVDWRRLEHDLYRQVEDAADSQRRIGIDPDVEGDTIHIIHLDVSVADGRRIVDALRMAAMLGEYAEEST